MFPVQDERRHECVEPSKFADDSISFNVLCMFMSGPRRYMVAVLCLVLMCSANTLTPLEPILQTEFVEGDADPVRNEILSTVPIWEVGDQWTYTVMLDAISLVEEAEDLEGASLDILTGTATRTVISITDGTDYGFNEPLYRVNTIMFAQGQGVFPAPAIGAVEGILQISMAEEMLVRVSDLGITDIARSIDIGFDSVVYLDIASVQEYISYTPVYEIYDFPIRSEDVHLISLEREITYTGEGQVSFPEDPQINNTERSVGPVSIIESELLSFPCEGGGIAIIERADDGVVIEQRHYCPSIRNDVYWKSDDIGLNGVKGEFHLISHIPGVDLSSSPDAPVVTVVLDDDDVPLDGSINITVDVVDVDGSPAVGDVHLYRGLGHETVTLSSGQAIYNVTSGNSTDDTITIDDWASHGFVVCYDHDPDANTFRACGVATVTIQGSAIGKVIREQLISDVSILIDDISSTGQKAHRTIRF